MQINLFHDLLLSLGICLSAQLGEHKLDSRVFITASHRFIYEASIDLVYSDCERLRVVLRQSELRHAKALQFVLICEEIINLVLVVIAYCRDIEELHIVLESYPEAPIVNLLQIHLPLSALSPLVRLITPITLPFFSTPGVSNLNQSLSFAIV